MRELEKTLKVLANRRRLAILQYIKKEREASVSDIAHEIRLSFKATSRHLRSLDAIDILEKEQRGPKVFYFLAKNQRSTVRHVLSII